jgi:Tol biopolymer transport system component
MKLRHLAALAVAGTCLAAPAAAQADSIVYIKDHNVWVAEPDGSRQHRVTSDGTASWAYGSPTQADNGTIVARKGTDIVRLEQNGTVLSSFDPPDSKDSAGQIIGGTPANVAVSPDGSKVAYTYTHANCPPGVSCGVRYVTLYSHADRATPEAEFGKIFRRTPSWVSNDRILAFNGFGHQVNLDSPGGYDDDVDWFDDSDMFDPSTDLGDGELSRQGDRLALVRGYGQSTHLMFYKVTGDVRSGTPSGPPAYACNTGEEETLESPTWSPEGTRIAFAHKDGVEVLPLPSVEPDCPGAQSGTVVVPGGSEPHWGPAPVDPKPLTNGPGNDDGKNNDDGQQGDDGKTPADKGFALEAPARVKVRTVLRKGLALRVQVPGAGKVTATASARKRVGSGRASADAASVAKVKVKFTKAAARTLKRSKKVTVKVTFKPADGGPAQTTKTTVRLTR